MKTLFKITGIAAIILVLASFQTPQVNGVLSNKTTRKEIMQKIANDHAMAGEMMNIMMDNPNGRSIMMNNMYSMMGNRSMMQQIFRTHPGVIGPMMGSMLNASKGDSSAYMNMYSMMAQYPQMLSRMYRMMNGSSGMHGSGGMSGNGMMGHSMMN